MKKQYRAVLHARPLIDPMEDNIEIDGSVVPDLFAPVTRQYLVDRSRQT
jgi:hypothetical protein